MSGRPSRGAARLAAILDALPDALLLVNANGTVVNANSIALDVFETPGTALIGRGLLDLLPAFDSKRIPGSMRRPEEQVEGRQPPTRMVARRTDGTEFPVEVTSANLEDGRTTYESPFEAAYADHGNSYTGNELLMLVVRDLSGTMDTEAELARQQRQTEMILRAAAEGVVGTDTEGRVVLVNPAAATILGFRAGDLGGRPLHPLVHHSRGDGSPLPYEETPLADTLRSGRKHRVRGQVLWAKDGRPVPVDMTTAPVRDGEQLVGAVLTFTDRRAQDAMEARQSQLLAVVDDALRGPLDQLRTELAGLAGDPAGQLWPEANQILHHLSAGYTRMTTLLDNVVHYQRLDSGQEKLERRQVALDSVIAAGVDGAVELIGPGRARFAVHAPPIEAEVDPERLSLAVAHLIADVAGVDATGSGPAGGTGDPTIVVAAARRGGDDPEHDEGAVVRIEVRGPCDGGSGVHAPIVRAIVELHGGVLQTHPVPGSGGGSAYVLEVPVGSVDERVAARRAAEAEAPREGETTVMPVPTQPARGTGQAPDGRSPRPELGPAAGAHSAASGDSSGGGPDGGQHSGHHSGHHPGQHSGSHRGQAHGDDPRHGGGPGRVHDPRQGPGGHAGGDGPGAVALRGDRPGSGDRRPAPGQPVSPHGNGPQPVPPYGNGLQPVQHGRGPAQGPGHREDPGMQARDQGSRAPQVPGGRQAPGPDQAAQDQAAQSQAGQAEQNRAAQGSRGQAGQGRPVEARPALGQGPAGAGANASEPGAGQVQSRESVPGPRAEVEPVQATPTGRRARRALTPVEERSDGSGEQHASPIPQQAQPGTGRRGRRAKPGSGEETPASGSPDASGNSAFALPPAAADRTEPTAHETPGAAAPTSERPTGRRRKPAAEPPPQPSAPEPQSPQQSAPQPSAPQPSAPQPQVPQQQAPEPVARPESGLPALPPELPEPFTPRTAAPEESASAPLPQGSEGPATGPHPRGPASGSHPRGPQAEDLGALPPADAPGPPPGAEPQPPQAATPPRPSSPPSDPYADAPHPGSPPGPLTPPGPLPAADPLPAPGPLPAPEPLPEAGPLPAPAPAPQPAPQPAFRSEPDTDPDQEPMGSLPRAQPMPDAQPMPPEAPAAAPTGPPEAFPPEAAPQRLPQQPTGFPEQESGSPAASAAQRTPEQAEADRAAAEQAEAEQRAAHLRVAASPILGGTAPPPEAAPRSQSLPMPGHDSSAGEHSSGISVRTLGQGSPYTAPGSEQHSGHYPLPAQDPRRPQPPQPQGGPQPSEHQGQGQSQSQGRSQPQPPSPSQPPGQYDEQQGSPGRRRRLAAPPVDGQAPDPGRRTAGGTGGAPESAALPPNGAALSPPREFAIGAPEAGSAEGPEPLDGPNGAVEVTDSAGRNASPHPAEMDDELPPEPLDNPRRLLVWPEPDVSTQQALTDRGYRPVLVHSREEVDAQIAAYPAALFVDPLTGPITRTALQSLRQAAVAAEVPVLVTAGLGQATREAAYGADPAVLLKALAPRDSEQHPPRVLLVEEQPVIAQALASTLERRGMQVAHAPTDAEAASLAAQIRPNLVVMDLSQIRRRRAGVIDWLRVNGLLNRTPFVVYTSSGADPSELARLASGETVLFLAERSTSPEVQSRIVDLLAKIGAA